MIKLENITETDTGIDAELVGADLSQLLLKENAVDFTPADLSKSIKGVKVVCEKMIVMYAESANIDEFKTEKSQMYDQLASAVESVFEKVEAVKNEVYLDLNQDYIESVKDECEEIVESSKKGKNEHIYLGNLSKKVSELGDKAVAMWKKRIATAKEVKKFGSLPVEISVEINEGYRDFKPEVKGVSGIRGKIDPDMYYEFVFGVEKRVKEIMRVHMLEAEDKKAVLLDEARKHLKGKIVAGPDDMKEILTVAEFMDMAMRFRAVWAEKFLATNRLSCYIIKKQKKVHGFMQKLLGMLDEIEGELTARIAQFSGAAGLKIYAMAGQMNLGTFLALKDEDDLLQDSNLLSFEHAKTSVEARKVINVAMIKSMDRESFDEIIRGIESFIGKEFPGEKVKKYIKSSENTYIRVAGPKVDFSEEDFKEKTNKNVKRKDVYYTSFSDSVNIDGVIYQVQEPLKVTEFHVA